MKVNVKGLVFVGFAAAILAGAAKADDTNIVTSKAFTDATYQTKIAGTSGQLVTSSGTSGTVQFTDVTSAGTGISTLTSGSSASDKGKIPTAYAVKEAIDTVATTAGNAQVKSTADFQVGAQNGAWKTLHGGTNVGIAQDGTNTNQVNITVDQTSSLANAGSGEADVGKLITAGAVKTAVDGKQDNLGGTGNGGKVVTASETPGTVTYTTVGSTSASIADTNTDLVTGNAVYDYVTDQLNGTGGVSETYQEKSGANYQVGGANGTWETMTAGTYTTLTRDATTDPNNPTVKYDINAATTAAGVTTGATTIPTSGAVADAIAAQHTTDNSTYQAKSQALSVGNASGGWTNAATSVTNDANTVPTTQAVYNYVQTQTGGNTIPAQDPTKCTSTTPCALVTETDGSNNIVLHWRVMAVSANQSPAAGTIGDLTSGS